MNVRIRSRVGIILINWQSPAEVAQVVRALFEQSPNVQQEIYVVNNGAREPLAAALEGLSPRVIEAGRNSGFSGACNLGIAQALADGADYVWLLNTDIILPPDCLQKLLDDAAEHPEAGLFSPVIYYIKDGEKHIWISGGQFDQTLFTSGEWFSTLSHAIEAQATAPQTFMLPGTALLISADAVRRVGLFDEKLFMYHEDIDFCIRASRAGVGRRLVVSAGIIHFHVPGTPVRKHVAYYLTRNEWLFWWKHGKRRAFFRKLAWQVASLRRAMQRLANDPEIRIAWRGGWWDGLLGRGGEMPRAISTSSAKIESPTSPKPVRRSH